MGYLKDERSARAGRHGWESHTYCGYRIENVPGNYTHSFYSIEYMRHNGASVCPKCEANPDLSLKLLSDLP